MVCVNQVLPLGNIEQCATKQKFKIIVIVSFTNTVLHIFFMMAKLVSGNIPNKPVKLRDDDDDDDDDTIQFS